VFTKREGRNNKRVYSTIRRKKFSFCFVTTKIRISTTILYFTPEVEGKTEFSLLHQIMGMLAT